MTAGPHSPRPRQRAQFGGIEQPGQKQLFLDLRQVKRLDPPPPPQKRGQAASDPDPILDNRSAVPVERDGERRRQPFVLLNDCMQDSRRDGGRQLGQRPERGLSHGTPGARETGRSRDAAPGRGLRPGPATVHVPVHFNPCGFP